MVARVWDQLVGRLAGPLSFRFVLQPTMAALLAIRAGVNDARERQPPFLWSILTERAGSRARLQHAWRDVGRLFAFAIVLDAVYQIVVLGTFYPLQAVAVAGTLAFVPYAAIRGLATRVAAAAGRRTRG